jgi:centrosomal protein POC5
MSSRSEDSSVPELPAESAGSSVSTSLQKEYEELLRYAVVTPKVIVPQMHKPTNKVPESITSTETSGESYEQDTGEEQHDVSGLPSTPVMHHTRDNNAPYKHREMMTQGL